MLGFDCDNNNEFLNLIVEVYFKGKIEHEIDPFANL